MCNFKYVHQGAARTELSLRADRRIWAWLWLGVCPQQGDEVSLIRGMSPSGRGGCCSWGPPGGTDKWVVVSLWDHSTGIQPGGKQTGTDTRLKTKLRMSFKSIQETGMYIAYPQGNQEKTHKAWVYAWCRVRGSGQNKTQAVTHTAPPCNLKVFYLADRQSHSSL